MMSMLLVAFVCTLPMSGMASWYGDHEGSRLMANGKRFQPAALTAASPCLPLGRRVRVTDLRTGATVVVVITDRGPFVRGRILDLSLGAAARLGVVKQGLAFVQLDRLTNL